MSDGWRMVDVAAEVDRAMAELVAAGYVEEDDMDGGDGA
jgi:hypothetical protein